LQFVTLRGGIGSFISRKLDLKAQPIIFVGCFFVKVLRVSALLPNRAGLAKAGLKQKEQGNENNAYRYGAFEVKENAQTSRTLSVLKNRSATLKLAKEMNYA